MKNFFAIILSVSLVACSQIINKPKNLIPKDTMANILAELAINDQLPYVAQNINSEAETKYVLVKYKVKGGDFSESYKYYLATDDLPKIYTKAQEIIKDKDPKAADYIEKKMKERQNPATPH